MKGSWLIRGGTVCLPDGMKKSEVLVENGRITAVGEKLFPGQKRWMHPDFW